MAYMRQEYFYQELIHPLLLKQYLLSILLHEPKYSVTHLDVDAYMYLGLNAGKLLNELFGVLNSFHLHSKQLGLELKSQFVENQHIIRNHFAQFGQQLLNHKLHELLNLFLQMHVAELIKIRLDAAYLNPLMHG